MSKPLSFTHGFARLDDDWFLLLCCQSLLLCGPAWGKTPAIETDAHLVAGLLQHRGQQGHQEGLSGAANGLGNGRVGSQAGLARSWVGLVLDRSLQGSGRAVALQTQNSQELSAGCHNQNIIDLPSIKMPNYHVRLAKVALQGR